MTSNNYIISPVHEVYDPLYHLQFSSEKRNGFREIWNFQYREFKMTDRLFGYEGDLPVSKNGICDELLTLQASVCLKWRELWT